MEEWQIPTTEQFSTMRNAWVLAGQQAEELQKRAILLGYNVVHSVAIEGGTGAGPEVSFSVWRWDQDRNADRQEFSSVPEVEAHLEQLAALPGLPLGPRWQSDYPRNHGRRHPLLGDHRPSHRAAVPATEAGHGGGDVARHPLRQRCSDGRELASGRLPQQLELVHR